MSASLHSFASMTSCHCCKLFTVLLLLLVLPAAVVCNIMNLLSSLSWGSDSGCCRPKPRETRPLSYFDTSTLPSSLGGSWVVISRVISRVTIIG